MRILQENTGSVHFFDLTYYITIKNKKINPEIQILQVSFYKKDIYDRSDRDRKRRRTGLVKR